MIKLYTDISMQRRFIIVVVLIGMIIPEIVYGQKKMTVHDCMEYAVSHSTKMRLQEADRSDEQWQRREAIMMAFTPSISAQTYAYNQYGRNLDPETNTYNNVTTFYNGYSASAGITLFNGFQAINNLRMANTSLLMGVSKQQQEIDNICLATMEAFANVIYYTQMEKVVLEQVSTARDARNKALRQEELGQKGHADVVQMESELAQKEYILITTQNQKNSAILTLKDVMYWPADEELLLDTNVNERLMEGIEISSIENNAKNLLPSAQIAAFNLQNATLDLKKARGTYSPTLSLYAGWSTTFYTYPGLVDYTPASFANQFVNNGGEYIQLQLSIPIFDRWSRRTHVGRKKNALVRAEAQYDQTMRNISNEVRMAINERDGAEASFRQAEKVAQVEKEAYHLSTKQYEAGLISAIEYQTASSNYLKAMAERMKSLLTLKIKDAVVRYYNGESYINQ